jgi:hypothetical protein
MNGQLLERPEWFRCLHDGIHTWLEPIIRQDFRRFLQQCVGYLPPPQRLSNFRHAVFVATCNGQDTDKSSDHINFCIEYHMREIWIIREGRLDEASPLQW